MDEVVLVLKKEFMGKEEYQHTLVNTQQFRVS